MTSQKLVKASLQLIAVAWTSLFLSPRCPSHDRQSIQRLGTIKLGETVKEFRLQYPKAVCGRTTSTDITPQTLVNSGNTEQLHCCLNDLDSLTGFSKFPILNLSDCAVHVVFWNGWLYSLDYILDVRSVQTVLHSFERLYGQPADVQKDPENTTRVTHVFWEEGEMTLELDSAILGGEVSTRNSSHAAGEPWLHAVSVNLWINPFWGRPK